MKKFTEDDCTIYVGENATENFEVIDIAKQSKNALWFHVRDIPSGHVVIIPNDPNETPSKKSIKLAAEYTKQQSKLKHVHKLTIQYLNIQHVRKTLKPGMVLITKAPSYIIV